MDNEKPIASFWYRLFVAVLSLLGAGVVLLAYLISHRSFNTFYWTNTTILDSSSIDIANIELVGYFAFIAGTLLTGFFGGRLGWRKIALIGLILFSVAIGISGVINTFAGLAAIRLMIGFGSGLLVTSLIVLVLVGIGSHWLLASAAALYFGLDRLSYLISPLIFLLAERFENQYVYMIAGGITLTIGLIGMGLLFISLLMWHKRTWQEEWLDEGRKFAHPIGLAFVFAAVLLTSWAMLATSYSLYYAYEKFSISGIQSASISIMIGAFSPITGGISFIAGWFADLFDWLSGRFLRRRLGRLAIASLGILVLCIGFSIFLAAKQLNVLIVALIVINLGYAILLPPLLALLISKAPLRLWGALVGLFFAIERLGGVGGSVVYGFMIDKIGWNSLPIIGMVVSLGALVFVILFVLSDKTQHAPPLAVGGDSQTTPEM